MKLADILGTFLWYGAVKCHILSQIWNEKWLFVFKRLQNINMIKDDRMICDLLSIEIKKVK